MTSKPTHNNIPALRFPEFQNDGEWEVKKFDDTFSFMPNNTLSRSELNNEKGIAQNIHYGDVLIKYGECVDVKKDELPFITDNSVAQKYLHAKLQNGDVVIADTAEDETVGKCSEVIGITNEFVVSGLHTIPIRPNNPFAQPYLGYYLNSESYRKQLRPLMQGVKVTSLSKSAISKTTIVCPKNIEEQRKIASCLSVLDEIISATNDKLEQLKAYKKGLMQKLFPAKGKTMPELRFKEFEKDGEWEVKKLGECFTERIERNCSDLPLLSLTESDGIVLQEETNRKNNSNTDKSKYLRVCVGDIAYNTMRMWQGRCAWVSIEGIVSPAYTICIPNEKMDSLFFFYLFKTPNAIDLFHRNSQGLVNDTLNLKYESFEKIKMCIPTYSEQCKIAFCLSAIDKTIGECAENVALLAQYKKGLMQKMFPTSK